MEIPPWDKTKEYSWGEYVSYNSYIYRYLREDSSKKSTKGVEPNKEETEFTANSIGNTDSEIYKEVKNEDGTTYFVLDKYKTEKRKMRSWLLIDAISVNPPEQPKQRVACTDAAITSAIQRGITSLSDYQPPIDWSLVPQNEQSNSENQPIPFQLLSSYPYYGGSNYEFSNLIRHSSREDKEILVKEKVNGVDTLVNKKQSVQYTLNNFDRSWDFYINVPGGKSTEYGITSNYKVPFTATDKFLLAIGYIDAAAVSPPIGDFRDNDGYFQQLVKRVVEDGAGPDILKPVPIPPPTPPPEPSLEIKVKQIWQPIFDGVNAVDASPSQAAMSMWWYGRTFKYRAFKIYYTYTTQAIRFPYYIPPIIPPGVPFPPEPVLFYVKPGGHIVVTGDGDPGSDYCPTCIPPTSYRPRGKPITETWTGPFSDPILEFSNEGTFTAPEFGQEFPVVNNEIQYPFVEETLVFPPLSVPIHYGIVWSLDGNVFE